MKKTHAVAICTVVAAVLGSFNPLGATATGGHLSDPIDSMNQSLRALGQRHDLRIGTAVDMSALASDETYKRSVAKEFSTVTAENVMKWEVVEPQRGTYDWAAADQLLEVAATNGQQVRGHTLLWHSQLPAWLTSGIADGTIGAAELRTILRDHIFAEVGHFRGRIWHWDVVNEVLNDDGTLRDTIWLQKLGAGYIADAFRWAHQADPKAKLYYNDYNIEFTGAKGDAALALVKQLKAQRVPIDGVGFQGHLGLQYGLPTTPELTGNLKRFTALGLDVAFTEVDVRMVMPVDKINIQAQAQGYSLLMNTCLMLSRCVSFTVWGHTDKYSWVPGVFDGEGAANILDENFQPKPAYRELQTALALATASRGR